MTTETAKASWTDNIPAELDDLAAHRKVADRVFRELLTQIDPAVGQALQALRDLEDADMELMLAMFRHQARA